MWIRLSDPSLSFVLSILEHCLHVCSPILCMYLHIVDLLSVTMLSLLNAMKLKRSLDHRKSFKFVYNGKAKRRATDGKRNPITTAHSTRQFHAISSYILVGRQCLKWMCSEYEYRLLHCTIGRWAHVSPLPDHGPHCCCVATRAGDEGPQFSQSQRRPLIEAGLTTD